MSDLQDIKSILSGIDPTHINVKSDGTITIKDSKAAVALHKLPTTTDIADDSTNTGACGNVYKC